MSGQAKISRLILNHI